MHCDKPEESSAHNFNIVILRFCDLVMAERLREAYFVFDERGALFANHTIAF